MARSHHRKKHREHLRNYQQHERVTVKNARSKVTAIFTLLGAATGFAIIYLASGSLVLQVIVAAFGAAIGYYIGNRIDRNAQ